MDRQTLSRNQREERGDERFGQEKCPPDQKSDPGSREAAGVGVEPSGRRHLLGELAHGVGFEKPSDPGLSGFSTISRIKESEPPRTRTWNLEIKSLSRQVYWG